MGEEMIKLVAKTQDNKMHEIGEICYTSEPPTAQIKIEQSDYYTTMPSGATIHLSTGMFDMNGREILVGDELIIPIYGRAATVIYDGECFFLQRYSNIVSEYLTSEFVKTLEVVR
jgi:hypothetical protein